VDRPWSLPVHPAQLYAALDAAILSWLAVAFTPQARRDGAVFALVLTLHPIARFLLEMIRIDEAPALGTPFSISQVVSIVLLALAIALWDGSRGSPRAGRGTARPTGRGNTPTGGCFDGRSPDRQTPPIRWRPAPSPVSP
jgi:phosphatidylglycerol:prolipoprotein diacylglycerol transferase